MPLRRLASDCDLALEAVTPSNDGRLASALALADSDVVLACDALRGANRKAMTAILVAQGLRPTRAGRPIAVDEAVHVQLDPPPGGDLAIYNRVRRTRNAGNYRTHAKPLHADRMPAARTPFESPARRLRPLAVEK